MLFYSGTRIARRRADSGLINKVSQHLDGKGWSSCGTPCLGVYYYATSTQAESNERDDDVRILSVVRRIRTKDDGYDIKGASASTTGPVTRFHGVLPSILKPRESVLDVEDFATAGREQDSPVQLTKHGNHRHQLHFRNIHLNSEQYEVLDSSTRHGKRQSTPTSSRSASLDTDHRRNPDTLPSTRKHNQAFSAKRDDRDFIRTDFEPILKMLREATPAFTADSNPLQTKLDDESWEDADADLDDQMSTLGDIMDDISYAPPAKSLSVRGLTSLLSRSPKSSFAQVVSSRPHRWTTLSLSVYMKKLLDCGMQRTHHRTVNRVTEEVLCLLTDKKLQSCVDSHTLNLAIDFLNRQGQFKLALELYQHLRSNGFPFDSLNFSRFISAAAREEDALNFRPVLEHMLASGFQPKGHVWYNFYHLAKRKYPYGRRKVARVMQSKGLLGKQTRSLGRALTKSLGWYDKSEQIANERPGLIRWTKPGNKPSRKNRGLPPLEPG